MSVPVSAEKRLLTPTEFESVERTHYPEICTLSRSELSDTLKRIREFRNKARDVGNQQRREMRGKADPRGARPAADNTGTTLKARIFSGALKRVNREIRRRDEDDQRRSRSQSDIARQALELRMANRVRHHPSSGRTAGRGMRGNPSGEPTVRADPREVGRVSQFVRDAQARRDSR